MLIGPDFKSANMPDAVVRWYAKSDVFRVNKEGDIFQVDSDANAKQPGYFMRMCISDMTENSERSYLRFGLFHTDAPDEPLFMGAPLTGLPANAMKELLVTEGKINDNGKQFLKYFKADCDNNQSVIKGQYKTAKAYHDFITKREGKGVYDYGCYDMSDEIGQFSDVVEKNKHKHPFEYGFINLSDKEADQLGIPHNEVSSAELLYEIPYNRKDRVRLFASMKAPVEGEYERDRQFVPVSELGKDKELLAWQMAVDYYQIYCSKMSHRVCNTPRFTLMPDSVKNEIQEQEHAESKERRLPNVPESQEDNQTQLGE